MARIWVYDEKKRTAGWKAIEEPSTDYWVEVTALDGETVLVPRHMERACDGKGWKQVSKKSIIPCNNEKCGHHRAYTPLL